MQGWKKLLFLSFAILFFIQITNAQTSWNINRAKGTGDLVAVFFVSSDKGWIVHSAGILTERREQITFVFMTDQQPSFEQPVQTIEAAVKLLREAFASSRRTFTPPIGVEIVPLPTPTRPDTERP